MGDSRVKRVPEPVRGGARGWGMTGGRCEMAREGWRGREVRGEERG